MVSLHGAPSSAELVEAVREWLERDVMSSTEGRLRFHARVAANVLATVERELEVGAEQHTAHGERLASLGVADDAELARSIRDGDLDDRLDEVSAVLRADVDARLRVANPKYRS
ncbi:MAG: hypothetical protein GKR86_08460 [Ilumatobacter sp.]|nr:hypothetical protein [Ilumatobacter sp.]